MDLRAGDGEVLEAIRLSEEVRARWLLDAMAEGKVDPQQGLSPEEKQEQIPGPRGCPLECATQPAESSRRCAAQAFDKGGARSGFLPVGFGNNASANIWKARDVKLAARSAAPRRACRCWFPMRRVC